MERTGRLTLLLSIISESQSFLDPPPLSTPLLGQPFIDLAIEVTQYRS
jgi:hypothetical protein